MRFGDVGVDLHGNQLTSLPAEIGKLSNLTSLACHWPRIVLFVALAQLRLGHSLRWKRHLTFGDLFEKTCDGHD